MKIQILIILLLCLNLSCSSTGDDQIIIRPLITIGTDFFDLERFIDVGSKISSLRDDLWSDMNHSNNEFAVKLKKGKLIVGEPYCDQFLFQLDDGSLEIINKGEFGGEFNFIPSDTNKIKKSIWNIPVNFVFEFKDKIYFLVGIPHGEDNGGAIFELIRTKEHFEYKMILELDSAPLAVTIYRNKILIAGHKMFTVVENFKKENILEEAFWWGLYPNNIAVKNENEIFIGMRGGYSELSLITGKAKFYQYIEK